MAETETFSVFWWDPDDTYYKELEYVGVKEAVHRAYGLANSVGGRIGTIKRIIVTDGGDCCIWEWIFGEGVVFPEELRGQARPVA